jgi:dolichol-phosphate mannosyltransferase
MSDLLEDRSGRTTRRGSGTAVMTRPTIADHPTGREDHTVGPPHERLWRGLQRRQNWLQLVRFSIVGASGYIVNLLTFTVSFEVLGIHHLAAATVAFSLALSNNFWWDRRWTFDAKLGRAHQQAIRFLIVSSSAFVLAALLLDMLLRFTSLVPTLAQAVSVAAATPLNFAANKMWTFRAD